MTTSSMMCTERNYGLGPSLSSFCLCSPTSQPVSAGADCPTAQQPWQQPALCPWSSCCENDLEQTHGHTWLLIYNIAEKSLSLPRKDKRPPNNNPAVNEGYKYGDGWEETTGFLSYAWHSAWKVSFRSRWCVSWAAFSDQKFFSEKKINLLFLVSIGQH